MSAESQGRRTYAAKHSCIRGKLLLFFAENPAAMISRQEACERYGVTLHGLEHAVTMLKRDGHIKTLYGPNRVSYYLKGDSPVVKLPKAPRVRKPPAQVRSWPDGSYYVAPKPIAISVFEWRP
jgi:hypothetical protein